MVGLNQPASRERGFAGARWTIEAGVRSDYAPEQRQHEEMGCLLGFYSNGEAPL